LLALVAAQKARPGLFQIGILYSLPLTTRRRSEIVN
jgi:hypothetical protein